MKRVYILLGSLVFLMGAFLLFGIKNKSKKIKNDTNTEKRDRQIKSVEYKQVSFSDTLNLFELNRPLSLRNDGSSFYTIDFSNMIIYRFSANGKLINTIGKGRGRGPGEMSLITDFFVDDKFVWVVDSNSLSIHKFTKEGEYLLSRTIKGHPLRISSQKDNLYLIVIGGNGLFRSIPKDLKNEESKDFGILIENQIKNILTLDGILLKRDNGGFIYVPSYASLIYFYNENDSLSFIVKSPDRQKFLHSIDKSTSNKMQIMAPTPDIKTTGAVISNDLLYVVEQYRGSEIQKNKQFADNPFKEFIDVYDVDNGKYLYSLLPPIAFKDFTIMGNTLLTISNSKIKKYEFASD